MPRRTADPLTRPLSRAWRRTRRTVLARRRPLAALCAALATAFALQAHAAPPPPRVAVLVADRDLPPGATVTDDDLTRVGFAPGSVPTGVLTAPEAVGRTTVGPVRAGEPLTDVRLLDEGLLAKYPGAVAVPVRIADGPTTGLLRVGDRVSVLATDPQGSGPAVPVAEAVPVLALPEGGDDPTMASGALVVLAVGPDTGRELAAAGARSFLSLVLVR